MSIDEIPNEVGAKPGLRRALGLWVLVFYGLGMIVGAGIYVLIGEIAGQAGMAAPLAFLLAAALAAVTGLAYAELVARLPEAAGEVAYVRAAFGSQWLSRAVGIAILFVALIAAASIARGSGGYVRTFLDVPAWSPGAVMVVAFTAIACLGIRQSALFAAALSVIEIGGLLFVIGAGADALTDLPARASELIPAGGTHWAAVIGAAYLAFFAFLGFENLANMAEETTDVRRTLPRAIVLVMIFAAMLYGLVALVAVLAIPPTKLAAAEAPLCLVIERAGLPCATSFAAIALIAVANGVIAEIILIARLTYGMAKRKLIPEFLGAVNPRTRVPVRATIIGGAVILILTVAVPFQILVAATSAITLVIFSIVNAALWRLHRTDPRPVGSLGMRVPRWLPPIGVAACIGLLVFYIVGRFI